MSTEQTPTQVWKQPYTTSTEQTPTPGVEAALHNVY